MPPLTDEARWLRAAFDGLERAESSSLAQLLCGAPPPARTPADHPARSIAATAGAFGLVLAASVLLGRLGE